MSEVTLHTILAARQRIQGKVAQTPLVRSDSLSGLTGAPVFLKLETAQTTGSFKLRGASNAVACLTEEQRRRGLITASTGNHGRALAYAGKAAGVPVVVCMSELVPGNKVDEVRRLGADVRIIGRSQDDAQEEVVRLAGQQGFTEIPPFDHPDVISGQGTAGLEIVEAAGALSAVLVPLSGGGLAAGVAVAVKALCPQARVIGISMERGAAMAASLRAGRPVAVTELETLADSLGGGIGPENRHTFPLCRDLLDEVILLSEDEIRAGIRHLGLVEGQPAEGAGAVGVAALLSGKVQADGPVVSLVSGRNIEPATLRAILA